MHDFPIPIIGFVGPSGSGKTTLLRKLVPELAKRGLRIGFLKHAHHTFDLDIPGKDSYEVRAAGAIQTLLASTERWALQSEQTSKNKDPALGEMLRKFDGSRLDLILVEGFKHAAYPKIEVRRGTGNEPPLYRDDPDVVAVATDCGLPGTDHLPMLDLDDAKAIADFVQRHMESWSLVSWTP
jgi:molybdopterin-guanine dinucleotide biosynthesis adapter protein